MAAKKNNETREMYVKTRRSWHDGSRIEIDFTSEVSVNGEVERISNYSVTLWISGEQHHTCTCMGYSRWKKNCCHITFFLEVEEIRVTIANESSVAVAAPVLSIDALIAMINSKAGKVVIQCGPAVDGKAWLDELDDEAKHRDWVAEEIKASSLVGNRFALPVPAAALKKTVKVSSEWLLGQRSA